MPGSPNLMRAALAMEFTPLKPARSAVADPPERSLHTAGERPELSAGTPTDQAFAALAAWLHGLHDADGLVIPKPPGLTTADAGETIAGIVGLLRRDMMLKTDSSPTGPTLVVMGLLVPVEVCALHRTTLGGEAAWRIEFLAQGPLGEVRLKTAVRDVLSELECDLVYALGPALAAFLRSHGVTTRQQLAAADGQQLARPTGHRPLVPHRVLAPALPDAAGVHVGRRLVEARAALLACGYHVPSLGYVPLQDASLEDWLRLTMRGVDAVKRKLEEVDELMARLTAAVQELCVLARVGGMLPGPRRH